MELHYCYIGSVARMWTGWRDHVGVLLEELEEVSRERQFWSSVLRLLPSFSTTRPPDERGKMEDE